MELPSLNSIMERYKIACDMEQSVDRNRIEIAINEFQKQIMKDIPHLPITFIETVDDWYRAARDARDARAAIDARDARAARAARAARDARDAIDARAAIDAIDARAARAARAARDAIAAYWTRFNLDFYSITAIGAIDTKNLELFQIWNPVFEAYEAGAWFFYVTQSCICVATIPIKIALDDRRRLHCENAPAFSWIDVDDYYWHGINVSEQLIMHPETIQVDQIENEANAEIRRVMVERYGEGRYLEDSGAKIVHEDETGKLYRKEYTDDEPLVMVRVLNSTPEPDGHRSVYWIPVPPTIQRAKQGVAWSFNMTEAEYQINFES